MAREISTDESGKHVAAAARKAKTSKGSTAGGTINPVHFTPGKSELYSNRGKK